MGEFVRASLLEVVRASLSVFARALTTRAARHARAPTMSTASGGARPIRVEGKQARRKLPHDANRKTSSSPRGERGGRRTRFRPVQSGEVAVAKDREA